MYLVVKSVVLKRDKLSSANHQRQCRHSQHNLRMFWTSLLFPGRQQRNTITMIATQAYSSPRWQTVLQLRRGAWASLGKQAWGQTTASRWDLLLLFCALYIYFFNSSNRSNSHDDALLCTTFFSLSPAPELRNVTNMTNIFV